MSLPLYMDVHVRQAITRALRSRGVDVLRTWTFSPKLPLPKKAEGRWFIFLSAERIKDQGIATVAAIHDALNRPPDTRLSACGP